MSRRVGSVDEAVLGDECGHASFAALLIVETMLDALEEAEIVAGVGNDLKVKVEND